MLVKNIAEYGHIYIACGTTDMRKGIHGLSCIVAERFALDVFSNSLFLFCGKSRKYFKAMSWDKNGFELYYKRLSECGATFKWPKNAEEVKDITKEQLKQLCEGFAIEPPKEFGEVKSRDFY
jgi:transposase